VNRRGPLLRRRPRRAARGRVSTPSNRTRLPRRGRNCLSKRTSIASTPPPETGPAMAPAIFWEFIQRSQNLVPVLPARIPHLS
jgi:hypothetical protein